MKKDYLLGSSEEELNRLALQHECWFPEAEAFWDRVGVDSEMDVLDAGCGPGFATVDLAERVGPEGSVTGVDASEKFLKHLEKLKTAKQLNQISSGLENLEEIQLNKKFDIIYSRWVFCFLKHPEKAAQKLAWHLKPGGKIAICDYFNLDYMLHPEKGSFETLKVALKQSWESDFGDLRVQQKMPGYLQKAGLKVIDLHTTTRVTFPKEKYWMWPERFFVIFVPKLVQMGLLTQKQADAFWEDWNQLREDPSAVLKTPTFLEIIAENSK